MNMSRTIDYWGIVVRSAKIAWENKLLWVFGFFAASGGTGGGNYGSFGEHGAREIRDFFMAHMEILVLIIIGIVLLWLVFLVLNVIAKGGLVSCIARVDRGERIRFEDGWNAGLNRFWGVLGIGLMGMLAFLIVGTVCAVAVFLPMAGGAPGIAVGIFIAAILLIPFLAFLFLLAFTIIYAEREYIVAGGTVTDALDTAWGMTRSYFVQTFVMWLVSFGSTIAFVVAIILCLLVMAVPFILIGLASPIAGMVLGIPIGIVFLILAGSAYSTYDYSLWTLLYLELRGEVSLAATENASDG